MHYTHLISVDELEALHASDAPLLVFDCSSELGNPDKADAMFAEKHIAGAVQAHLERDLSAHDPANAVNGGRHPLPKRELFAQTLQALGWQTTIQDFTYRDTPARNILAHRAAVSAAGPTPGPTRSSARRPFVLLGAHYDTRLYADNDPDVSRRDEPVPGANDGASGVAVLLELARSLDAAAIGDDIWLAFFDAEDNGRINGWEFIAGSRFMAQNLPMPTKPEVVIVVDMIGDADQQIYLERNSDEKYQQQLWQIAARLGFETVFIAQPKWTMVDDHIPFKEAGIPAVDIIDFDYPYWHTTQDTTDKLSGDSLERVGRVLEVWLEETR